MQHLNNLYTARDHYIIIFVLRMLVRKSDEQREYTMKKYRLNINENAGLNIRVIKCFNCQTSEVVG